MKMDKEKAPIHKFLNTVAIIPAAGAGVRMSGHRAKQFLDIEGRPLLALTLEKFQACPSVDGIILVVPSDDMDYCRKDIIDKYNLSKVKKIVAGGKRRQDSVRLGVEASGGDYALVLIHDGVRPLIAPALIEKVVSSSKKERAIITALPAKETIKEINKDGFVVQTYDRSQVWMVQTPQVFRYEDILMAHQRAVLEHWEEVTDDALLLEKMGIPVKIIEGSEDNIKITTPHDLELALFLFRKKKL